MSRARNIKPGFFKNDRLAECQPLTRILFAALWCEADREGRLEDRPRRLKAECLPYDDCDVDSMLDELAEREFIVRYSHGKDRYIQVLAFNKHQNPHMREPASTIPAPCEHSASTVQQSEKPRAAPEKNDESTEPARLFPLSPSLIPDSSERDCASPDALDRDQAEAEAGKPKPIRTAERFDEFWAEYPVKKGRAEAESKWRARSLDAIADQIIADVRNRKQRDRQWLDGYAPHGSTYVNGRGWEDAIDDRPTGQPRGNAPQIGGSRAAGRML